MPALTGMLELDRCPYCNIDKPSLIAQNTFKSEAYNQTNLRVWKVYLCNRCGGFIIASSSTEGGEVKDIFPQPKTVSEAIPARARTFLEQSIASVHAPAGAVMLAASSVDAMLKEMGSKDGTLNSRILSAAKNHLITEEMANWAHDIRIDANEQRHADEDASLPTSEDAERCIEFAIALGEFLFVLPSRVKRGREKVSN